MCVRVLLFFNRFFKKPLHPFNMQNDKEKTYAEWQFEKGADTIAFYTKQYTVEEMFAGKRVLDIGCGAAGKSLYYVSCGAKHVTGIDVVARYENEAYTLAEKLGLRKQFSFIAGDAANLPFESGCFDTIIMNDAMEHVDEPERVLEECERVLCNGGRIFINFPPYHHPFGAHLSDAISIPWVHLFFRTKTLIAAYKKLVSTLPDGQQRIDFRIAQNADGKEYFSYINQMTIKRFDKIMKKKNVAYYKREVFHPVLAKLFPECFTRMVVCVIQRKDKTESYKNFSSGAEFISA